MTWIDDALAEFGRSLGLETLEFNEQGVLSLAYEVSGDLYLERMENCLLIYLCRELQRPDGALFASALDVCHWRHNHAFPVNPALYENNQLVFSVRLREEDVTVPTLEEVIQLLNRLHDHALQEAAA